MPQPAFETRESEFWYNVSEQEKLPIAGEIELDIDIECVHKFFERVSRSRTTKAAVEETITSLTNNPALFGNIRQFLGVSDKRAYLELSYRASRTKHPSANNGLCGCDPWTLSRHPMGFFLRLLRGNLGPQVQSRTAIMLAEFLFDRGLLDAARGFAALSRESLGHIYTNLISPKEYQQRAAKRRGHGCEAGLARVLVACGTTIAPRDKATNPMGTNDPHLDLNNMKITPRIAGKTHAFDILVMNKQKVIIAVQSLVHTSDPGQFGVDKSNETVGIATRFRDWRSTHARDEQIELWGLVDGVGFCENKENTINKLLRNFDYFVQLRTLYKVPLRLHKLGLVKIKGIHFATSYDKGDIESIVENYVHPEIQVVGRLVDAPNEWRAIEAGDATVFL